jgi:hypothetical protein
LLENAEIISNLILEEHGIDDRGNEVKHRIEVEIKDELRVISYVQAIT